jgi:hypothetical protein
MMPTIERAAELASVQAGRAAVARAALAHDGFTVVPCRFTPDEIRAVEEVIDGLVQSARSPETGWRALFGSPVTNEPSHREIYRPALRDAALRRSRVFLECQGLAEQLLGARAHYLFDHAIYKLPHGSRGVHWHQDQAYLGPSLAIRSLHFWIPFQDVDGSSGCLRFVPASHTGLVCRHTSAYDEHPHLLRADIVEPAHVVEQPMALGDVSVHTNFTLHASGPNRSGHVRKAWIIHFGDRPRWHKHLLRLRALAAGLGVPPRKTAMTSGRW